jgi:hypothetical protein
MSHFDLCGDDCYQNCKVIVTKTKGDIIILQWMKNDLCNYRGMAAQYWMSHQYHLAFYF